jgi:hypothetical protein
MSYDDDDDSLSVLSVSTPTTVLADLDLVDRRANSVGQWPEYGIHSENSAS